jgi:ATP-dependent RNA helicase DDX23/PRP28
MAPPAISNGTNDDDPLIDPSLLEGLSDEQRKEALAAAATAKRAEERAEQRALERALQKKEEERRRQRNLEAQQQKQPISTGMASATAERAVFVPKRKRGQQKGEDGPPEAEKVAPKESTTHHSSGTATAPGHARARPMLSEKESLAVRQTYLGKTAMEDEADIAEKRKKQRPRTNKKTTFKFRWEDTDDTFDASDPLYSSSVSAVQVSRRQKQALSDKGDVATVQSCQTKPLDKMTARDWRIFRENYEITVKGGKSPPPMRSFRESPSPDLPTLHPALLDAIENVLGFKEPTPIQRQSIPIGLQRRDLIGVAETGSGKTVAFGVPLCHYLLNLPKRVLDSVAEGGPLALVMAPTRELALQIDGELQKLLSRQQVVKTCGIVGGQPILQQATILRNGVHIVVGTPGRLNDMLAMSYMVLNNCSYIIMDEADRMVDMGFKPQMQSM